MTKKWTSLGFIILIVVAAIILLSTLRPDRIKSFASFTEVDDFPLYVMTYYGDYGFDLLLQGAEPTSVSSIQFPECTWACSVFSTSNPEAAMLLGRNFDWYDHPALLLFTDPPNGYASVSMVDLHYLGFDKQTEPSQDARSTRSRFVLLNRNRPQWLARNKPTSRTRRALLFAFRTCAERTS